MDLLQIVGKEELKLRREFEGVPGDALEPLYKIYSDGNHYIASICTELKKPKRDSVLKSTGIVDDVKFFNQLYDMAMKLEFKGKELRVFLLSSFSENYPCKNDIESFIDKNIKRRQLNSYKKKKRFRRKVNMNHWNFFVTFTYDSSKQTEEEFRKSLRKCLSNFASRRRWRYIGVWERGEDNDRLHFHALLFVPDGQMVGEITRKNIYDKKSGQLKVAHVNSFFLARFGHNDFDEVRGKASALNYLMKYIEKSGERLVFSRGVPSEVYMYLKYDDLAAEMNDYGIKFVLFDDVFYYHKTVYNANYEQMTFLSA